MNTINPQNLPKIHWQNQIVITTELLAKCYGAKEKQIRQNYANNKARFVEGVHFFKLEGEQLRAFKQRSFTESCGDVDSLGDFLGQFGFQVDVVDTAQDRDVDDIDSVKIARNINSLTLWTERGAARHSKILDTDLAWDMFDRLETAYFHSARPAIPAETQTIIRNLQAELLNSRKRMDKVLRLQQAGFSKAESARMLAIGETTVRKEAAILKRCGFRVDAAGGQLDLFGGRVMMVLDAKDRLATVATCLEAVADLAVPATDLSAVDRDKLSVLLLFLTEEYQAAAAQLGFR